MALAVASAPGMGLPKQNNRWADLKAAYRLLNNARVRPDAIQAAHRRHTLEACGEHAVVLCVEDTTELDFTRRRTTSGLGLINSGDGRGLLQHSALAVSTQGRVLGVLDQRFVVRTELHTHETRTQLEARWRESLLWGEAMERIGRPPPSCRLVAVTDRAGDCFETMEKCDGMNAGFLIRALRDRNVEDRSGSLWSWARQQHACGTMAVTVSRQAKPSGRVIKTRREANVSICFGQVTLDPPLRSNHQPRKVWIVYAREEHPPPGEAVEAIDWLLLCSEEVGNEEAARRMLTWYSRRWVIEEWHRVLKEGCGLEASQLKEAEAIMRLAAVLGVVAVRLLQLRDLAGQGLTGGSPEAEDPAALRCAVPLAWVQVIAVHRGLQVSTLTPREFWLAIAHRGGFIGRKADGRPGWRSIWRGWHDYLQMVEYAEALARHPSGCG